MDFGVNGASTVVGNDVPITIDVELISAAAPDRQPRVSCLLKYTTAQRGECRWACVFRQVPWPQVWGMRRI